MTERVERPLPVLAVTARAGDASPDALLRDGAAALRECARNLGLPSDGDLLRVEHADPRIVEVCLSVGRLPDQEPPPPIAAEMLTPGTIVSPLSPKGAVSEG